MAKHKKSGRSRFPTLPQEKLPRGPSRFRKVWLTTGAMALLIAAGVGYLLTQTLSLNQLRHETFHARGSGDWARTAVLAADWLHREPQATTARLCAAEAERELGHYLKCADYLEGLHDLDPVTPDALMNLVELRFGVLNQPLQAEATLLRILRTSPQHIGARTALLNYYGLTCQHQKLSRQARDAVELGSESPATYIYLMGPEWITYPQGPQKNKDWLQSHVDDETFKVAALLHEIRLRENAEEDGQVSDQKVTQEIALNYKSAIDELLTAYPRNPELLAYALEQAMGDIHRDLMVKHLKNVPATSADDHRFWRYQGWYHAMNQDHESAIKAYREAIRLNPYDWRSRHLLAAELRTTQDFEEAERLVETGLVAIEIRRAVMQLKHFEALDVPLLTKMQQYADRVGDKKIASQLTMRLALARGQGL